MRNVRGLHRNSASIAQLVERLFGAGGRGLESGSSTRALGNAELRVLVRTFFPWDACFSLDGSSAYACFFNRHALKIQ